MVPARDRRDIDDLFRMPGRQDKTETLSRRCPELRASAGICGCPDELQRMNHQPKSIGRFLKRCHKGTCYNRDS